MWYDADIDAMVARTARRPIPRGQMSGAEALGFGLILACSTVTNASKKTNRLAAHSASSHFPFSICSRSSRRF
jgi:protoheme IX farnesyltransferase